MSIIHSLAEQAEEVIRRLQGKRPEPSASFDKPNWIKDLTGKDIQHLRASCKASNGDENEYMLVINPEIIHLEWKNEAVKNDYFFYVDSKTIFVNGELKGRLEMDQLFDRLKLIMIEVEGGKANIEVR